MFSWLYICLFTIWLVQSMFLKSMRNMKELFLNSAIIVLNGKSQLYCKMIDFNCIFKGLYLATMNNMPIEQPINIKELTLGKIFLGDLYIYYYLLQMAEWLPIGLERPMTSYNAV